MAESLHDADGFPRSDVPLDRILPLRQEFRILQSDHSVVMNTIERALKSGVPLQSSIEDAQSAGIVVSANDKHDPMVRVGDIVAVSAERVSVIRFTDTVEVYEIQHCELENISPNLRQLIP